MKRFVLLTAVAVLSLSIGSAYAHQVVTSHLGQKVWGLAYNESSTGDQANAHQ
jgi:hypothetical protein